MRWTSASLPGRTGKAYTTIDHFFPFVQVQVRSSRHILCFLLKFTNKVSSSSANPCGDSVSSNSSAFHQFSSPHIKLFGSRYLNAMLSINFVRGPSVHRLQLPSISMATLLLWGAQKKGRRITVMLPFFSPFLII